MSTRSDLADPWLLFGRQKNVTKSIVSHGVFFRSGRAEPLVVCRVENSKNGPEFAAENYKRRREIELKNVITTESRDRDPKKDAVSEGCIMFKPRIKNACVTETETSI